MNPIFAREGWKALAGAWVILVLSIAAAASIVAASHWYLQRERSESMSAGRRVQDARTRLESAQRERDSLQESAEVFHALVERGLLQSERRLDLVEMLNALRSRHQLFSLNYEMSPQRPLPLGGGRVFPSVDVLSSRVNLRIRALHEGDVLGFIDDLAHSHQGFYTVDRCRMRRVDSIDPEALVPHVEADCTMEWITVREKRANRPA